MKFRECVCQVSRHANASLYMPLSGKPFFCQMGSEEKYRASASLCERLKCELFTSSIDHDIAACDAHAHDKCGTRKSSFQRVFSLLQPCTDANMFPFYGSVVLQMYIFCKLFVRFLGPAHAQCSLIF